MESTKPSECLAQDAVLQSVMDGDCPVASLKTPHLGICAACRSQAAAASLFLNGFASPVAVPTVDFAARIVPSVLAERQRARIVRRTIAAFAASVAASIVVAVFAMNGGQNDRQPVAILNRDVAKPSAPPSVEESFREAGSAFVSLTKRTAAETLTPARNLLAGIEFDEPPTVAPVPVHSRESELPVAPIANTAKRAINLFLRDVGSLAPATNMKS